MDREKKTDFVTHYQQEVKIGKVYAHINSEIKKLNDRYDIVDERYDNLNILVTVLKTTLENINRNVEKMVETNEKTNEGLQAQFKAVDDRISKNEEKISGISDKNKMVSTWLSFIGVISVPLITGLTALAGQIFK